jgi:hypothetical protein
VNETSVVLCAISVVILFPGDFTTEAQRITEVTQRKYLLETPSKTAF